MQGRVVCFLAIVLGQTCIQIVTTCTMTSKANKEEKKGQQKHSINRHKDTYCTRFVLLISFHLV